MSDESDPISPMNVVSITQEQRLKMIQNPHQYADQMSSEYLKLLADADKTAMQELRLKQEDKHASEDHALRKEMAEAFVTNVAQRMEPEQRIKDVNREPPRIEKSIRPELEVPEEATEIGHSNVELDDIMASSKSK